MLKHKLYFKHIGNYHPFKKENHLIGWKSLYKLIMLARRKMKISFGESCILIVKSIIARSLEWNYTKVLYSNPKDKHLEKEIRQWSKILILTYFILFLYFFVPKKSLCLYITLLIVCLKYKIFRNLFFKIR